MVKPLTVYKASAGSGKTFTLAVEYIKLVVRNPQSYRNILAVTFTNKATEEMKMRILSQLYGIWKQLPDSQGYMNRVCEALDASPTFVSQQAGLALHNLLHNYNYFRVMTIDTFFQSVLRNLARELDLTANLRIGLNDNQVEEQAVDTLIEELSTTDVLLQWILKYIMENISDDRSWNVIGQIKQFGKTIFRDYYKEKSRLLNDKLAEPDFFDNYTTLLRQLRNQASERMLQIAETFFGTLEEEGLTIDDLSYGRTGIGSFFLKLQNGVFDESIVGKRVTDCVGQPEKWYKKSHPRRDLIHTLADGQLDHLLRYALEERPLQWRIYKSAELTLRHLNQLRLLSSIEHKVRQLNDDANRFLLSDTQQLLHALISDSDSPFIFEKIGTQLEHVMIDEFQDTSTVQWQNFRVLLQETMSHRDTENLIVGDVKQSIYRWRSGDWRLLNAIEQQFPQEMLQVLPLDTNYRSDRRIIEFNNAFFTQAAKVEHELLEQLPDADQLLRAYADVEQKIPTDRPNQGYISLTLLPAKDYQNAVLARLADTVSTLRNQGVSERQMAILVRTNKLIPLIAKYFSQQLPDVSIVSDEAFRLDASTSVNTLVQALHLLTHPDDQLSHAYLVKSLGTLPTDYTDHTAELLALPLYDLAERLYALFGLQQFSEQSAYVCAFFDQLSQFVADNAADIDTFLRKWDEELCSKTIQSDEVDGLRLISIHKSKGLEFDHVIIPFCDWQLEKQTGEIVWCQPKEEPFNQLPIVPVDYSPKGMKGTIYADDYSQEHLQNMVDNLNLLYVAFTRASHSLYVIGKRGAKNSRSVIIESVLPLLNDGVLTGLEDNTAPLCYEYGTPDAAPTVHKGGTTKNVFLQAATPCGIAADSFTTKATFRQSNQSVSFTHGDDTAPSATYIQLGSVLHNIFSTIRTTADIDDALRQLETDGVLYDDTITLDRLTTMLRRRLEDPRVASWYSPHWRLFNECTILTTNADGQVIERRPDRVMTDGTQWIVVDFKFGHPRDEYHDQVRQYMQLLADMGHQHITGYLWFVYSNQIIEVK